MKIPTVTENVSQKKPQQFDTWKSNTPQASLQTQGKGAEYTLRLTN